MVKRLDYLNRIVRWMKLHWIALICACVVGLVSLAPVVLIDASLGKNYRGIIYSSSNDDYVYMSRMQEIIDGHILNASPFYYEYKDQAPLILPFGEYWYVIIALVTGISLSDVVVLSKFLFPAALFLLVYFLVKKLSYRSDHLTNALGSITAGFVITLGYDLVDYRSAFDLMFGIADSAHYLVWTRPVNPITGALSLFAIVLLMWNLLHHRKYEWLHVVGMGIILASMTSYVFSWGIAIAVSAIIVAVLLATRRYHEALRIVFGVVFGIALMIPYWLFVFQTTIGGDTSSMGPRNGMFFMHTPIMNKFVVVGIIFFIVSYIYFKKNYKSVFRHDEYMISAALLVGSFLALNQHVLTGITIWPYHFVQYTIPLTYVAVIVIAIRMSDYRVWMKKTLHYTCVGIVAICIWYSVAAASSYTFDLEGARKVQGTEPIVRWLRDAAPRECVALTIDRSMQDIITAYTGCNDYIATYTMSGVPFDRIVFNYLVYLRLQGVSSLEINDYLNAHSNEVRSIYYPDWHELFSTQSADWLDQAQKKVAQLYVEFEKTDFMDQLKKYQVDYFVNQGELTPIQKNLMPSAKKVFQSDGWFIYVL